MKSLGSFIYLFLIVVLSSSCAHKEKIVPRDIASLQAGGGMEGIWFLQGTSSVRGPYNGELELRKSHDGTYDVVRVATYINYFFDGLKVQEVWTGKAVAGEDSLVITYDLRQGDFVIKLGTQSRESTDFRTPIAVDVRFKTSSRGLSTQFSDKKSSSYTEWITTRRGLEEKPLWVNERQKVELPGNKVARGLIFDPTDFDFYRKNADIIRVINKITDEISIAESVVKRNSYAPSLEDKARGFARNTNELHFNDTGVISSANLGENGKFLSYETSKDAALWTSFFLGSQAIQYLVEKDSEALRNVRLALKGLKSLAENTEGLSEENLLVGLAHGFLWASLVTPESDEKIWSELRLQSQRLLKAKNKGIVVGLAAWLAHGEERERLQKEYQALKKVENQSSQQSPLYGMIELVTDITLADLLGESEARDKLRERLLESWSAQEEIQGPLLTLAAYGFAYKQGARSANFRVASTESRFQEALRRVPWGLREIPYPRPNWNISIDHSLKPEEKQGAHSYPAFELHSFSSDFVWKERPFTSQTIQGRRVEHPGVDYLYAYWLARYVGVNNVD